MGRARRRLGNELRRVARGACAALALSAALLAAPLQETADVEGTLAELAPAAGVERPAGGWTWQAAEQVELAFCNRPELPLPPGWSRGRAFARLRRVLDALGAPEPNRAFAVTLAELELIQENERAAARVELEHGLATFGPDNPYLRGLQLDLAALEIAEGSWTAAARALDSAAASFPPTDRARIEGAEGAAGGPPDAALLQVALDLGRWHGTRAELELALGRLDRAEGFVEAEERIAGLCGDANLAWSALDHRLRLESALSDFAGVRRSIAATRADRRFAAVPHELRRKLEIREGLALYELERRGLGEAGTALELLRAAAQAAETGAQDRVDAAIGWAKLGAETGRPEEAREAISIGRAALKSPTTAGGRRDPRTVELDALEASLLPPDSDPRARREALAGLEAAVGDFLASWASAPVDRAGVGFLHFGDRYLVLSELVRACVAADPREGPRRALGWIYESQRLGGLARSLEELPGAFEPALARVVGGRRGAIVLQPGRLRSHLFLADESGVAVHDVAPSWKLLDTTAALGIEAARAVRRGGAWNHPALEDALAELARELLPAPALARLLTWEAATVVGDESLRHLPLDALPLEDGRRLGDALALQYAPSLPVAAALAARSDARGRGPPEGFRVRIVGAPEVGALDAARWAPESIAIAPESWTRWSRRSSPPAELRIGAAADRGAFLSAAGEGVDAAQIVAHGLDDASRACRAGFLLAPTAEASGAIWSEDVERTTVPRLCLLAVCGASRSLPRRGDDGRSGLAASFVLAGADCVVLASADLEVGAAVALFERVHLGLARGEAAAMAIRGARLGTAARGEPVPLQDYLVHAWGWGLDPLVEPAPSSRLEPAAAEAPRSLTRTRWRWIAGGAALLLGLAVLARARRA